MIEDTQRNNYDAVSLKSKVHRNLKKYMSDVHEEVEIGARPHGTRYRSNFMFSHDS